MKKFIALFACAFMAFIFEGCAPRSFETYNDYDEEEAPAPKRKTVAKAKPAPVVKKKTDYEVVTDNLYPIPKALDVDNDLTIVSLAPVGFTSQDHCNEVYFFSTVVTPSSGYHGLVDISMSETKTDGGYSCKYFGTAVTYKIKPNPFIKEIVKYEDVVRKYEAE